MALGLYGNLIVSNPIGVIVIIRLRVKIRLYPTQRHASVAAVTDVTMGVAVHTTA